MNANLFLKPNAEQSLSDFVEMFATIVECDPWQEHESSNYVDGHYFQVQSLGLKLTLAETDFAQFSAYDFWLCIESEDIAIKNAEFLEGMADCIARKAAKAGLEIVRPFELGNEDAGSATYRRDPQSSDSRPLVIIDIK